MHKANKNREINFYETVPGQPSATPPSNQPDPQGTPTPTPSPTAENGPDLTKLTGDQLVKVLENPELWNLPRIKELRESAAEAKKLKDAASAAETKNLEDNKKFEELAQKRGTEVETLNGTIKNLTINQALTNKLVPEGVVDVDGALKLVDRSKLSVDDLGNVTGLDEALTALKTDKPYLFSDKSASQNKPVGTPTNPGNGGNQPSGPTKFKRSQITPEFYKAHAAEINSAMQAGQIEDDGPAQH